MLLIGRAQALSDGLLSVLLLGMDADDLRGRETHDDCIDHGRSGGLLGSHCRSGLVVTMIMMWTG